MKLFFFVLSDALNVLFLSGTLMCFHCFVSSPPPPLCPCGSFCRGVKREMSHARLFIFFALKFCAPDYHYGKFYRQTIIRLSSIERS